MSIRLHRTVDGGEDSELEIHVSCPVGQKEQRPNEYVNVWDCLFWTPIRHYGYNRRN